MNKFFILLCSAALTTSIVLVYKNKNKPKETEQTEETHEMIIKPTHFAFYKGTYPFTLSPLTFTPNALEPHMDRETVMIHHDKHHQTYTDNLNKALEKYPELHKYTIEELLTNLDALPADIKTAVTNNGGGYFNHNLFFDLLTPESTRQPAGDLAKAIEKTFGSFEEFKKQFSAAALGQFGSGWAWLCVNKEKSLVITATANQLCPISQNLFPILVIDVWEHAYYLQYRNKRIDFIHAWWNLINWDLVEKLYQQALTTGEL